MQANEPTRLQRDEALAALTESFKEFASEAISFPRQRVREKPSTAAFSATEIVYHMLDVERLWQKRIRGLLDGSVTTFQQMNPDAAAVESGYNEMPYETGIANLRAARDETHDLIQRMGPSDFERVGIHSKFGELNTWKILEIMEGHDRTHAAQLRRTLTQISEKTTAA